MATCKLQSGFRFHCPGFFRADFSNSSFISPCLVLISVQSRIQLYALCTTGYCRLRRVSNAIGGSHSPRPLLSTRHSPDHSHPILAVSRMTTGLTHALKSNSNSPFVLTRPYPHPGFASHDLNAPPIIHVPVPSNVREDI